MVRLNVPILLFWASFCQLRKAGSVPPPHPLWHPHMIMNLNWTHTQCSSFTLVQSNPVLSYVKILHPAQVHPLLGKWLNVLIANLLEYLFDFNENGAGIVKVYWRFLKQSSEHCNVEPTNIHPILVDHFGSEQPSKNYLSQNLSQILVANPILSYLIQKYTLWSIQI